MGKALIKPGFQCWALLFRVEADFKSRRYFALSSGLNLVEVVGAAQYAKKQFISFENIGSFTSKRD